MIRDFAKKKILDEIKRIHKKLGRRPVKRDNYSLYFKSRKHFGSWNNAMESAGYEIKFRQYIEIPEITDEFCYFVGLVISDGHLQILKNKKTKNCKYTIYLTTSYSEELELIVKLIKKIFNYNPYFRAKKKYGWNKLTSYEIQINSKKLLKYINQKFDIPIGAKSKSVKLPSFFYNSEIENTAAFLRGIIDGDGCINKQRIEISSGSNNFRRELVKLFKNKLNITSKIYSKGIGKIKTVCIIRKEDIKKLYCLIYPSEFYYPRKKLSWDKLLKYKNI